MNTPSNANSIGQSLGNSMSRTMSNTPSMSNYSPSIDTSTASSSGSFFSRISWVWWLVIIMILAFLGFNIFLYLAKGTQYLTNTFGPLISLISSVSGNLAANTTKQVVSTSATGTKAGVDVAANSVNTGVTSLQQVGNNVQGPGSSSTITPETVPSSTASSQSSNLQNNPLNNALNAGSQQQQGSQNSSYQADDSYSRIQSSNSSGKAGWCYIGEERGVRSCSQVGANDTCMSGDIFPSNEVCMNPHMTQN